MSSSVPDPAARLAVRIRAARAERRCLPADDVENAVSPELAYRVQANVVAAREQGRATPAGWKLGYTSAVMREQMGIAEANFGPLDRDMLLAHDCTIPESVIQPRVEPEIALVLAADVPGSVDALAIRAFVRSAHAALEVVDSVWCGYRFTWAQNTADGSSAAFVVLGPELDVTDLAVVPAMLERNGERVGSGFGAAAMGDPFAALAWLAGRLLERGQFLRAGQIVITGGLTAAVPLEPGDTVSARIGSALVTAHRSASGAEPTTAGDILVP